MNKKILCTLLIILLPFAFFTSAFAQKGEKSQPEAWQVPANQVAPPKARFHSVKMDTSYSSKLYAATERGLQISEDGGLSWRPLLVGGQPEEVFALAVHPLSSDTLFVGRRDGLWKSQDGGKSWGALPSLGSVPLSIAIAKSQPDTLYVATARRGVYKSVDGGYQWGEANNGLPEAKAGGRPEEIHTLAVDPLDPDTVYAALEGHGVYRTTDGSKSWHKFNQRLSPSIIHSALPPKLAFDPQDPQRLYLAFNERIHSHLVSARLFVLSDDKEWLPVEVDLPSNVPILDMAVDGVRQVIQLWGSESVWEVPLWGGGRSNGK